MPLIYITGPSGAGKSTLCREIKTRGLNAYDGDELSTWVHRISLQPVERPGNDYGRSKEWSQFHTWNMSVNKLLELSDVHVGEDVYICGNASNRYELWDRFDKVFSLIIDQARLTQRISDRTDNDFGKYPGELEAVIEWQKVSERLDKEHGAILIDASKPVSVIADFIIGHSTTVNKEPVML
jgi:energy-coupling factor transporter ATP-binding protein EcfA2